MNSKGTFIVLYGVNNLGKSTQAKLLVERLNAEGHVTEYQKYPVYDVEPSGPMINDFLREGNPYDFSYRESQLLNVINRMQLQPKIEEKLAQGITIVAEDYTGSGLSWGIGTGVDETFMKTINSHLLKEDLAFVFHGDRFTEATERTHQYETDDDLQKKSYDVFVRLGEEYGWIPVNANDTIENIHESIWETTKKTLG